MSEWPNKGTITLWIAGDEVVLHTCPSCGAQVRAEHLGGHDRWHVALTEALAALRGQR